MDINFPLILVVAVFITGLIALVDRFFLLPRRLVALEGYRSSAEGNVDQKVVDTLEKQPAIVETSVSIFPVLLLVLVLRSFLFEPFQIPSGSMIPTLEVGDFILVNKYKYGLRLPVVGTKILSVNEPKRGEVMVFKEPKNPNINFIKRVVGLPGDKIRYSNKRLTINGEPVPEQFIAQLSDKRVYRLFDTTINGRSFEIRKDNHYHDPRIEGTWVVPEGHYFMMGDNRDQSSDSRVWGFVPEKNIVGKAVYVWMHWPKWTKLPNFKNNGTII